MKNAIQVRMISALLVLSMAICLLMGINVQAADGVTVYRLYNPANGEHLYSTDYNEAKTLVQQHGWNSEGIGFIGTNNGEVSIYRVYNPKTSEHHYTTDANERKVLCSQGWNDEGVAWKTTKGGQPVYRVYNSKSPSAVGSHHYTADANEYNVLKSRGWNDEKIAWYSKENPSLSASKQVEAELNALKATAKQYIYDIDRTQLPQTKPLYNGQSSLGEFQYTTDELEDAMYDVLDEYINMIDMNVYGKTFGDIIADPTKEKNMQEWAEIMNKENKVFHSSSGYNGKKYGDNCCARTNAICTEDPYPQAYKIIQQYVNSTSHASLLLEAKCGGDRGSGKVGIGCSFDGYQIYSAIHCIY